MSKILFDYCNLSQLDPWDIQILPFLNPAKNPSKNCQPSAMPISKLENGQLFVFLDKQNASCWRRCLLPKNDYELKFETWMELRNCTRPRCDIIEVECREKSDKKTSETVFYKFLHAQIYRSE